MGCSSYLECSLDQRLRPLIERDEFRLFHLELHL